MNFRGITGIMVLGLLLTGCDSIIEDEYDVAVRTDEFFYGVTAGRAITVSVTNRSTETVYGRCGIGWILFEVKDGRTVRTWDFGAPDCDRPTPVYPGQPYREQINIEQEIAPLGPYQPSLTDDVEYRLVARLYKEDDRDIPLADQHRRSNPFKMVR